MPSMVRYLSPYLFTADFTGSEKLTRKSSELRTARDVGFKEKWLRDAIAGDPELVPAPCRAARLVEEDEPWTTWKTEVSVANAGSIDVLLVSKTGRIGIVETKLAYNPEARREVVAQVLEYAIHLPSCNLPEIPRTPEGKAFVAMEDIRENIHAPLLIIAGDRLDARVVK